MASFRHQSTLFYFQSPFWPAPLTHPAFFPATIPSWIYWTTCPSTKKASSLTAFAYVVLSPSWPPPKNIQGTLTSYNFTLGTNMNTVFLHKIRLHYKQTLTTPHDCITGTLWALSPLSIDPDLHAFWILLSDLTLCIYLEGFFFLNWFLFSVTGVLHPS